VKGVPAGRAASFRSWGCWQACLACRTTPERTGGVRHKSGPFGTRPCRFRGIRRYGANVATTSHVWRPAGFANANIRAGETPAHHLPPFGECRQRAPFDDPPHRCTGGLAFAVLPATAQEARVRGRSRQAPGSEKRGKVRLVRRPRGEAQNRRLQHQRPCTKSRRMSGDQPCRRHPGMTWCTRPTSLPPAEHRELKRKGDGRGGRLTETRKSFVAALVAV
jgi:hypothetical protein